MNYDSFYYRLMDHKKQKETKKIKNRLKANFKLPLLISIINCY